MQPGQMTGQPTGALNSGYSYDNDKTNEMQPPSYQPPAPYPTGGTPYYPPQQFQPATGQYAPPPAPGQPPYYAQPQPPMMYGAPSPAYQQQQQVTIINSQGSPMIVQSFAGHIGLACFVFWCCNPLFGLIAFILAVVASDSADPTSARQLGKASMGMSIAGIVVAVVAAVILGIVLGIQASNAYSSSSSICYNNGYSYYCK